LVGITNQLVVGTKDVVPSIKTTLSMDGTMEAKLVDMIDAVQHEIAVSRSHIEKLREQLVKAESKLIEDKLHLDKLNEELRLTRARKMPTGLTDRQKEINAFRDRMPEVMKKLEGKDL
jgi:chromosome segregation ATPase